MKKVIITLFLALGICTVSFAQSDLASRLYGTLSFSYGGAPKMNFTKEDFAIRSFNVELGYRPADKFSIFLPVSIDINLLNTTTTRNYNETGTVGLGTAYAFPLEKNSYIEPALSCSTTYVKTDVNYLTPKFEVRWGVGRQDRSIIPNFGLYCGVGVQYIHPYDNAPVPDMFLGCATVGIHLF
jgi:hypothetical protein